jgi:hypothetical protein
MCTAYAAVANLSLLVIRPAPAGDVLARKIYNYIEALERLRI